MAGWDFTADSEIQRDLAEKLGTAADNFDSKVGAMYNEISGLGAHWEGEDYDMFGERTESYKPALQDLSNGIRMFGTHYEKVADATDTLATDLIGIINNMTGSSAGGSGANPGGAGVTSPEGPGTTPGVGTGADGTTPNLTVGQAYTDGNGNTCYDYTDENGNVVYTEVVTPNGSEYYGPDGTLISSGVKPGVTTNPDGSYTATNPYASQGEGGEDDPTFVPAPGEEEGQGFWAGLGQRYVDDWNDFTGDVTNRWSKADGLISGIWATADTVVEGALFVVDGALDTVEGAADMINAGTNWLFDLGTGRDVYTDDDYWAHIGEDYAENWDYSTVDNVWEGIGVTVGGVLRTGVDAVQTVVNAADWVIDGVGEVASGILDGVGDALGALGGLIFG